MGAEELVLSSNCQNLGVEMGSQCRTFCSAFGDIGIWKYMANSWNKY